MAKFVLVYTGSGEMGQTPEEQQQIMEAWMGWFGSLGEAVVDFGNPFGPSVTVGSDGAANDGTVSKLGGYSILEAADLADAADKAKGCPVLSGGGAVEIYEALPIG